MPAKLNFAKRSPPYDNEPVHFMDDTSQSVWCESIFGVLVVSQQSLNLSDFEPASLLPSITKGPTLPAVYWAYITMK